jgi:phosphoribosyl-ATP pyrophosphohydrolase
MPKQKKKPKQPRTPKLPPELHAVERLYRIIASRKGADPHTSYTARLLSRGPNKIAQKLGEEATETVIEAVRRDRDLLVLESADMLYHLLALWASLDIDPKLVWRELKKREGRSGIEEKKSRKAR